MSLLSRGAWIEISVCRLHMRSQKRRSSHEERGLKSSLWLTSGAVPASLLSRGAWIEIDLLTYNLLKSYVAPLTRSVD